MTLANSLKRKLEVKNDIFRNGRTHFFGYIHFLALTLSSTQNRTIAVMAGTMLYLPMTLVARHVSYLLHFEEEGAL